MTTTPASFYVVAFFFKVFGNYIIIDRILGILAGVLTIFICSKLFKLKTYWQYVYLISIAMLSVSEARAFFYNDAILIALIALYFLIKGTEKNSIRFLFIAGIFSGLCFIFKQSIGGLLLIAFAIGIILVSSRKNILKAVSSFMIGEIVVLVPVSLYFIFNHAFPQALYYIFSFANSVKSHQSSFLLHRLVAIPIIVIIFILFKRLALRSRLILVLSTVIASLIYIFLDLSRVGRIITYLPDLTFYMHTLVFLFPLIMLSISLGKNKKIQKRITIIAITYLALFLSIAASGYSMGPVVVVAPLLIPLLVYCLEVYGEKIIKNIRISSLVLTVVVLVYVIPFSHSPLKSSDSVFGAYKESQYTHEVDIPAAKYIQFPENESKELLRVIQYIQKNTKEDEKIFCFPYCPGLLFLTEREGGSYYNLFYFETFMAKDQDRVVHDLQKNNVRLVVLQKRGGFEQRKDLEEQRLPKIRKYIDTNYSKVLETLNFIILKSNFSDK